MFTTPSKPEDTATKWTTLLNCLSFVLLATMVASPVWADANPRQHLSSMPAKYAATPAASRVALERASVAKNPKDHAAHYRLGLALWELGDQRSAILSLAQAIDLKKNTEYLNTFAWLLLTAEIPLPKDAPQKALSTAVMTIERPVNAPAHHYDTAAAAAAACGRFVFAMNFQNEAVTRCSDQQRAVYTWRRDQYAKRAATQLNSFSKPRP